MAPNEPEASEQARSEGAQAGGGVAFSESQGSVQTKSSRLELSASGRRWGRRPARPVPGGRARRWLLEAVIIVAVALGVAVVLRSFVVQTFYIPSESMQPTLQVGDRILVNKLSYHLHGVGRSDIVVFRRPPLEQQACSGPLVNDLVKRVIGLPGETISLSNDGRVEVNGKRLAEPWLPASEQGATQAGPGSPPFSLTRPYHIPPGEYFLMGDNRTQSCDSRYWGPIPRSLIVGRVELRIWPINRIGIL